MSGHTDEVHSVDMRAGLLVSGAADATVDPIHGYLYLVNCPTQPTCIAHCDLCICQLSRRWKHSLALSKMFEPSHRP